MWEINSYSQILTFLYSLILGFFLGIFYDLLRGMRYLKKNKKVIIFITDLVFWLFSAFCLFCFSLEFSKGEIRGYYFFGSLIGFIINFLTLSNLSLKIFKYIFLKTNTFLKWIFNYKNSILDKVILFFKSFFKKILKIWKKALKK